MAQSLMGRESRTDVSSAPVDDTSVPSDPFESFDLLSASPRRASTPLEARSFEATPAIEVERLVEQYTSPDPVSGAQMLVDLYTDGGHAIGAYEAFQSPRINPATLERARNANFQKKLLQKMIIDDDFVGEEAHICCCYYLKTPA
jgi:hypothetical protein